MDSAYRSGKTTAEQDQCEGRRWNLLVRSKRGKAAQLIVAGKRRYKGGALSVWKPTRVRQATAISLADCGAGLLLNDGRK